MAQAQFQLRGQALASGLKQASAVLQWTQGMPPPWNLSALRSAFDGHEPAVPAQSKSKEGDAARPAPAPKNEGASSSPRWPARYVRSSPAGARYAEGGRQAEGREPAGHLAPRTDPGRPGASQIAQGAGRAHREVTQILNDPVGRRALDRLLLDEQTVHEHPELLKSFAAYITPDGHRARIDLTQSDRVFSNDAMNQVLVLRAPPQ